MVYIDYHLNKYPLMTTQDVLKLYLQGILGPAHLVLCIDNVIDNLNREYESIDVDYNWDMVEQISDDYVRIYIKPFYDRYRSFESLAKAFYLSANEVKDKNEFLRVVESLKDRFDEEYICRYIASGNLLISHSQIYKDNYHPHYLVINKKYLDAVIK